MSRRFLIIAIFMTLLLPAMIEGQHPEVLLKDKISKEIAALTLENGFPLKPVFSIPEEKIDDMIREGVIKMWYGRSVSINLYEALIEVEEDPISYLRSSKAGERKHAFMKTSDKGGAIYNFRGHCCEVRIPEHCDLQDGTSFNLYNIHLVFPDGNFIESGVGWISPELHWGTEGLNLYTFNSYDGEFSYEPIDEDYGKEIFLAVEINGYQGLMFASDHSLGNDVYYGIRLSEDSGCVDQTQEQHSFHSVWTPINEAHYFDNTLIKGRHNEEIPWTYDFPTGFGEDLPLHYKEETWKNSIEMVTWCG